MKKVKQSKKHLNLYYIFLEDKRFRLKSQIHTRDMCQENSISSEKNAQDAYP